MRDLAGIEAANDRQAARELAHAYLDGDRASELAIFAATADILGKRAQRFAKAFFDARKEDPAWQKICRMSDLVTR